MTSAVSPLVGGQVVPWCDATEVEKDDRLAEIKLPSGVDIAKIVLSVSGILYRLSGSRWMGAQKVTIRPHRLNDDCHCDMGGVGQAAFGWSGIGGWWNGAFPEGWGCSCIASEQYVLPGGRVSSVDEVKVDGVVLDAARYVLYDNRRLVRVDDPTSGAARTWPCCQRLSAPVSGPGTWQIIYTHGQLPPPAGELAAYEYAIQTARRFDMTKNKLAQRTTTIRRQDVDITIEATNILKDGRTGFPIIDEFIEAYNPKRLQRRAQVFSPDTISPAVVGTEQ